MFVGAAAVLLCATACATPTASAGADTAVVPGPAPSASGAAPPAAGSAAGVLSVPLSAPSGQCVPDVLETVSPHRLTVAANTSAGAPWFASTSGGGVDPAVVAAVADGLGFAADAVVWVAPSARHDVQIGAVSGVGVPSGSVAVGYAPLPDVVVVRFGAKTSGFVRVGVVSGSAGSVSAVRVGGTRVGFGDAAAALAALRAGTLDAAVVPADAVAGGAGDGLTFAGRLRPSGKVSPPQAVMVMPANTRLSGCVAGTVDRLRVSGVLGDLFEQSAAPVFGGVR